MPSLEQIKHDHTELAEQAEKLCATATLFADKIENEVWKAGLLEQVDETRVLIRKAPKRSAWNGELQEEDLEVNRYFAPGQPPNEQARGARVRHKPTDITRESYSKGNYQQNVDIARKSLTEAVAKSYSEDG